MPDFNDPSADTVFELRRNTSGTVKAEMKCIERAQFSHYQIPLPNSTGLAIIAIDSCVYTMLAKSEPMRRERYIQARKTLRGDKELRPLNSVEL